MRDPDFWVEFVADTRFSNHFLDNVHFKINFPFSRISGKF